MRPHRAITREYPLSKKRCHGIHAQRSQLIILEPSSEHVLEVLGISSLDCGIRQAFGDIGVGTARLAIAEVARGEEADVESGAGLANGGEHQVKTEEGFVRPYDVLGGFAAMEGNESASAEVGEDVGEEEEEDGEGNEGEGCCGEEHFGGRREGLTWCVGLD